MSPWKVCPCAVDESTDPGNRGLSSPKSFSTHSLGPMPSGVTPGSLTMLSKAKQHRVTSKLGEHPSSKQ